MVFTISEEAYVTFCLAREQMWLIYNYIKQRKAEKPFIPEVFMKECLEFFLGKWQLISYENCC